jgi:hypothetical protein
MDRVLDWTAAALLCGWFLYFRSVYSASAYAGDLAFIGNNLNSIRYVDGVLALSEIFLVTLMARFSALSWVLVLVNCGSRMLDLYAKIPPAIWSPGLVCAAAAAASGILWLLGRRAGIGALVGMVAACPFLVERNRAVWNSEWNDLKPSLELFRSKQLGVLGVPDGGYFAGQVVAAGNPVHTEVRSFLPEELQGIAQEARPRYLAILVTSGSDAAGDWQSRYAMRWGTWRYHVRTEGKYGAILERDF